MISEDMNDMDKLKQVHDKAVRRGAFFFKGMIISILLAIWIPLIWKVVAMFAILLFVYFITGIAISTQIKIIEKRET